MNKSLNLIKDNINLTQIHEIKAFTELGSTKKLFEIFWAGQYNRVIDTALIEYKLSFPFEKSMHLGATSWISGRVNENNAYLVYAIYKEVAPDNSELNRKVNPNELSLVAKIFNIKYHRTSPLNITKVYSLLNCLINKNDSSNNLHQKNEGVSFHDCSCGNHFIARCSTATATCQWCRSKIKRLSSERKLKNENHVSSGINMSVITRMVPSNYNSE
jgi:hypothetical protein